MVETCNPSVEKGTGSLLGKRKLSQYKPLTEGIISSFLFVTTVRDQKKNEGDFEREDYYVC